MWKELHQLTWVQCRGVTDLNFQGRPARGIEFYPMHFFQEKCFFYVYDVGFQVGPAGPKATMAMPLE